MNALKKKYALVGFAFWQAWQMLVMHAGVITPVSSPLFSLRSGSTWWIFLISTFTIVPVALYWAKRKTKMKHNVYWFAGVCSCSGTLGVALSQYMNVYSFEVFIAGALLYSVGNAFILFLWGEYWSTLKTGRIIRTLICSYAFAFILFYAIIFLPKFIQLIAVSLLMAASLYALTISDTEDEKRIPVNSPFSMKKIPWVRIVVFIAIVSCAFGFAQTGYSGYASSLYRNTVLCGSVVVALAMALTTLVLYVKNDCEELAVIYKPIIPCVSAALILFSMLHGDNLWCSFGLMMFGIYCLDVLIMIIGTDLAFRSQTSVAITLGITFFSARAAAFCTRTVTLIIFGTHVNDEAFFTTGVLVLLFALVLCGMLIFTQADLQTLFRLTPDERVDDLQPDTNLGLQEHCAHIAKQYDLTARESEVFLYLARGRSIPYLCNELNIAENTGKRHVSNIYRKLCVYDRQGLLDLVEYWSSTQEPASKN